VALPTTTAVSGQPIKNDGATVLFGGNIDSTNTVTNAPNKEIFSLHTGSSGSRVPTPGGQKPTFKPISAGAFASQKEGEYIIRRFTNEIAGIASTLLNSGASDFGRRSIHLKENRRTTLMVTAGWNFATGQFLTSPTEQLDAFGNDDAARPTRAVPGELVFHSHGPANEGALSKPLLDKYKAKTG